MKMQPWRDTVELARAERGHTNPLGALRMMRTDAWMILLLFRVRRFAVRWHIPLVNQLLRFVQLIFFGIELGKNVSLGDGVYFIHSVGTVVGGDSRLGNRVRLMGSNTIGTARDNGYPVIEDDVEIGCGARILGPVRVGARTVIGANAVVVSDLPPDSVAVGIPARFKRKVRVGPAATAILPIAAAGSIR